MKSFFLFVGDDILDHFLVLWNSERFLNNCGEDLMFLSALCYFFGIFCSKGTRLHFRNFIRPEKSVWRTKSFFGPVIRFFRRKIFFRKKIEKKVFEVSSWEKRFLISWVSLRVFSGTVSLITFSQ